jgi:predicted transcriptional regulator
LDPKVIGRAYSYTYELVKSRIRHTYNKRSYTFHVPLTDAEAIRRELIAIIEKVGSQNKTAKLLGLSQPSVTDFMNGGGLGPKMLAAVLRESGKSLNQLTHSNHREAVQPTNELTPTPMPSSALRFGHTALPLPEPPANRQRALELLVERGFDQDEVAEEMALAALDARLAPCEDRPVAWWVDMVRVGMARRSRG